jgi:hypothetical protein
VQEGVREETSRLPIERNRTPAPDARHQPLCYRCTVAAGTDRRYLPPQCLAKPTGCWPVRSATAASASAPRSRSRRSRPD